MLSKTAPSLSLGYTGCSRCPICSVCLSLFVCVYSSPSLHKQRQGRRRWLLARWDAEWSGLRMVSNGIPEHSGGQGHICGQQCLSEQHSRFKMTFVRRTGEWNGPEGPVCVCVRMKEQGQCMRGRARAASGVYMFVVGDNEGSVYTCVFVWWTKRQSVCNQNGMCVCVRACVVSPEVVRCVCVVCHCLNVHVGCKCVCERLGVCYLPQERAWWCLIAWVVGVTYERGREHSLDEGGNFQTEACVGFKSNKNIMYERVASR